MRSYVIILRPSFKIKLKKNTKYYSHIDYLSTFLRHEKGLSHNHQINNLNHFYIISNKIGSSDSRKLKKKIKSIYTADTSVLGYVLWLMNPICYR